MPEPTKITTDQAPAAIGPYSQAMTAGGFVFTAGQIPLPAAGGELVPGGIREQTKQSLANLAAILEAAGSSMGAVIKTTVFLADMGDFQEMNAVYQRAFGEHAPARSTVEVARLPKDALVEIEAIALRQGAS